MDLLILLIKPTRKTPANPQRLARPIQVLLDSTTYVSSSSLTKSLWHHPSPCPTNQMNRLLHQEWQRWTTPHGQRNKIRKAPPMKIRKRQYIQSYIQEQQRVQSQQFQLPKTQSLISPDKPTVFEGAISGSSFSSMSLPSFLSVRRF